MNDLARQTTTPVVIESRLPKIMRNLLIALGARKILRLARKAELSARTCWAHWVTTRLKLVRNKGLQNRRLEIGAGGNRVPDFETLNIQWVRDIDYVLDASKPLPFKDGTFEIVYASHILEHIPWYKVEGTLKEWARILKPDGRLEIWVPDGLKICKALVDYELHGENYIEKDGWYRYNPERDPYKWAAGRLFTYGDGTGDARSPNWHRSIFTERYLRILFEKAGLKNLRKLSNTEVRGYDHGWINLGMTGTKL